MVCSYISVTFSLPYITMQCLKPWLLERLISYWLWRTSYVARECESCGDQSNLFFFNFLREYVFVVCVKERDCPGVLIAISHSVTNKRHILEMLLVSLQASKQASRAVSMEIAFVITLPMKPVLGLWSRSRHRPLTAHNQDCRWKRRH